MQAHWCAHRQARGFLVKLTSVLCTGMCSDTLREILGIRPGSSARPSCCNRMGNPLCVSCHLIFPPRGCSSCASQLGLCFSYLGIHFGFLFVPECEARIALGGFSSFDKMSGQCESFWPVTPSTAAPQRVTCQGLKQQEGWEGKGSFCILAHPSAKLATLSQCQQTCRVIPFSTRSGHG